MVKSHMENLGTSQEKAARRPEVDRVKELIKTANSTRQSEDPDFPVMDAGYKDVIRSFGLQGVETVDDLFNKTEAPGYNPAIAREKLVILSTAVYEVMLDEKLEEAIVAGSFTTEKYLPSELVGQDKNNPEGSRFASMVVQNFIDNFGTEEKKAEVSGILEYLDYINNSEYNKGSFLAEQADEAYVNLKKVKPNVMNKDEMGAYVKAVEYVSKLKTKHTVVQMTSEERARREAEELARIRQPRRSGEDEEAYAPYEASYDMKKERFIEMESQNRAIRWYDERPPKWFEDLGGNDVNKKAEIQEIFDIRLKLLNACASKEYFRNKDIEKLRGNVPEFTDREFKLMWEEMPGFKEGVAYIVKDLCEKYTDDDGRVLLRLKTVGDNFGPPLIDEKEEIKKDKNGNILYGSKDPLDKGEYKSRDCLDSRVKWNVEHFSKYREKVAKALKEKKIEGMGEKGEIEATSAAWNFLYIGDSIESWDYFRELKPTSIVSDKLRTMDHPMIKALGKWGVWKGYEGPNWDIDKGQEEPFVSGTLSTWVLDRIKEEPTFKNRLIDGDLKDMLPRTLVVSMIEATQLGETNLATAIMDHDADWITERLKDDDKNLMQPHNDMVQGGEFILNLIKGKIQYAYGKNDAQFVSDFIENTSLIRQEPNIPLSGGGLGTMGFVDRPEFFTWALTIACGFDPYDKTPLLNVRSLGGSYNSYDLYVQDLIAKITQRSSVNKKTVLKMLAGSNMVEVKKRQLENLRERSRRKEIF